MKPDQPNEGPEDCGANPDPDYHQREGISQSKLKLFASDPVKFHAIHVAKTMRAAPPTRVMQRGTLLETYLREGTLGGNVIPDEYLSKDGFRRGNAWKAFKELHADHEMWITPTERDRDEHEFKAMAAMVESQPKARELLCDERGEWNVQLEWNCPMTGILRKAELDRLFNYEKKCIVADLKLTAYSHPSQFWRNAHRLGYAIQAYTYAEALVQSGFAKTLSQVEFWFVPVNDKPTHYVWPQRVTMETMLAAKLWNDRQMQRLVQFADSDNWMPETYYDDHDMRTNPYDNGVYPDHFEIED